MSKDENKATCIQYVFNNVQPMIRKPHYNSLESSPVQGPREKKITEQDPGLALIHVHGSWTGELCPMSLNDIKTMVDNIFSR